MKKKIKIAFLGANFFCGNRGVNALAYSSFYLINKVFYERNVNYELYLLDSAYKGESKIIKLDKEYPITLFPSVTIRPSTSWLYFIKDIRKNKSLLGSFDYFFDISGGDSFSDIYGQRRFDRQCISKRFYRFKSKKYIFLPQTIGPFKRKENYKRALSIMANCDAIFTRDKISFQLLGDEISKKSKELIDVAFFLPYSKKSFNTSKIHIGINISALIWHGGYTKDNQFKLKVNYKQLIYKLIHFFLMNENTILHLIPHVLSTYNYDVENDYAVCKKLAEEFNDDKIILAPYSFDPCEIKSYISGLDFFIGARMHACIAAFSSGVPVCPMAYSMKFNGLFNETIKYPILADMVNNTTEECFEIIFNSYNKRDELKKIIYHSNDGIISQRKQNILDTLINLINE